MGSGNQQPLYDGVERYFGVIGQRRGGERERAITSLRFGLKIGRQFQPDDQVIGIAGNSAGRNNILNIRL